uniref:Phosphatidate phosphatase APP1 catalytic domain-containing protein n=1 Tax=viral metagenome TaxID=1070528 RepID=A0A6C0D696_9ZZZZ
MSASVKMTVDNIYEEIKSIFISNKDLTEIKKTIIKLLLKYCKNAPNTDVFELKTRLETNLAKDVNCSYCNVGNTPKNIGCDLREIIFDIDGNATVLGKALLQIFKRKKLENNIWHILTDIDDTLFPHPGNILMNGIAGKDRSWTKKTPYPGIHSFYNLFYETIPNNHAKYSTVLSATPGCLKFNRLNNATLHEILGEKYGFIQGTDSKRVVLTRNPLSQETYEQYGKLKFERFTQYFRIFPEYNFVFIGDNGQGDVFAGMSMLDYINKNSPTQKCYVLIHKISEDGQTYKSSPETHENLFYFENYYEAAQKLHELSIIENPEGIKDKITQVVENSLYESFYQKILELPQLKSSASSMKSNRSANTAKKTASNSRHGGKSRHTKKRKNRPMRK